MYTIYFRKDTYNGFVRNNINNIKCAIVFKKGNYRFKYNEHIYKCMTCKH